MSKIRIANTFTDGFLPKRSLVQNTEPMLHMLVFWLRLSVQIILLIVCLPTSAHAQEAPATADDETSLPIVINEILVDPLKKHELLEFIELYNPNPQSVDLSYWTLSDAVDFFFTPGTLIEAGGYLVVAQDPGALWSHTGVTALGPFVGRLDNEGEAIILRDNHAAVVDEVSYGLGFPWPITSQGDERSLQLLNPALDNSRPGAWRSAPPTPGASNANLVDNPPPAIEAVSHTPTAPTSHDTILVSATVADNDGIAGVYLHYQVVAPGAYIRIEDPAYLTQWTTLAMTPAGDDRYSVEMPPEARLHRHLVRYRVSAIDHGGRSVLVPYGDDPQPNFAYFVYDGIPIWHGTIRPGAADIQGQVQAYDFDTMRPLPVYHFLARRTDVEDAQFIPNSQRAEGYMGGEYLWRGTLVYNGQVYDHIGFRARGALRRYSLGKNMWKFNFHPGHRLQALNDYGEPYPTPWDKLNLSGVIQHAIRGYRGEQGLFESVGYRLFNLADAPASNTHFVHFRVIDGPDEQGVDQYGGDFWGLYLAIEEVDGHFLDARDLPDGNLYKMENGTGELNNQGLLAPTNKSDLNTFLNTYTRRTPDADWWRQNFDLTGYYSFRTILEAIRHYDTNLDKNYFYFHNPDDNRWSIIPWDLDITWALHNTGDGNEPFRDRVLAIPEFQIAYQNRLRELRDLLFNPDQAFLLIDEYAALINTPDGSLALVDADRAKWDYNPILTNRKYVEIDRAGHGKFYLRPPSRDFAGMVQLMKEWVVFRSQWIDQTLLTDPFIPETPTVSYNGPPGYPADQLSFQSTPFTDSYAAFAAIQWRAAQVVAPGLPGYVPDRPNRYEIEATWQSGELTTFTPAITLPPGSCLPGYVCRVRVRMKNTVGRWSHWSPPVEFHTGPPAHPPITTLKITELMYHPLRQGYLPETEFEFIELKNVGETSLDLTGLRFIAGISFMFPAGTVLPPGEFAVLASNSAHFETTYGLTPLGEYRKKLGNSGDRLTLTDAFGRTLIDLTYDDAPPWPVLADGVGHSLVLQTPERNLDPNLGTNWRASLFAGGSPGADDPLPLVINEVLAHPAPGQTQHVELHNPSAFEISLAGWSLRDGAGVLHPLPGESLPSGGYRAFTIRELSQSAGSFDLVPNPRTLELVAPAAGKMRRYQHTFRYRVAPPGVSTGRYINAAGQEKFPLQSATTLGGPNADPAVGPVVMSEIQYSNSGDLEFIELTNLTSEAVPLFDPERPANTWLLAGVPFQFATGVLIPPDGKIVVTSGEPSTVCTGYTVAEQVRVLGPLPFSLDDEGQRLVLERPLLPDADGLIPYVVVDELAYTNLMPWPRAGEPGATLVRLHLAGYGDDPLNWRRGLRENSVIQPAGAGPVVDLCSFEVFIEAEAGLAVRWVTRSEQNVAGFFLYRSADGQREHAEQVTGNVISAEGGLTTGGDYHWLDATANTSEKSAVSYTYWLVATGPDGELVDLAFTSVRPQPQQAYLPFVYR